MGAIARVWRAAALVLLVAGAGCSLLTTTDGLASSDADAGPPTGEGGIRTDATTEGGATDGGTEAATKYRFTDDFNRPDTASGIGNGWNEKALGFRLAGGQAERLRVDSDDYRDTIASRPSAEAVTDVEVSAEFRFEIAGGGFVQVHARIQTAALAIPGRLDSYLLFRNLNTTDGRTFTIARQIGTDTFVPLMEFQTVSVIDTANRYRLRLRVTGAKPVVLAAFVERLNGATWEQLGSATATDNSRDRIEGAGVVGISAGNDPTGVFAYDNFSAQGL